LAIFAGIRLRNFMHPLEGMNEANLNSEIRNNDEKSLFSLLLPVIGGVLVVYLVIGMALPVIPLHVHNDLGLGSFVVGLVAGAQFTASLISRFWSGAYADKHGGRRSMTVGLTVAVLSGFLYWLSLRYTHKPVLSISILILGRAILGAAESFILSGAMVWGLATAGAKNTGRVMSWIGTAMYLAFAFGAPLGTVLYKMYGFEIVAYLTAIIPLLTLLVVYRRNAEQSKATAVKPSFIKVIRSVWIPGLGLAFSSLGFGAITTFLVLLFHQSGWNLDWLGLSVFATAFVIARVSLGHLPDKIGGARIALLFALIETVGLLIIWLSPTHSFALAGAGITGFGYALAFPGFGVEAVLRTSPKNRGLATGMFTAFLDLTLGLANPALGYIGDRFDLKTIFLVSAGGALLAAGMAVRLRRRRV